MLLLSFPSCDIKRITSCVSELLRANVARRQQFVDIAILRNTEELCGADRLSQLCVNSFCNGLNVMGINLHDTVMHYSYKLVCNLPMNTVKIKMKEEEMKMK